MNYLLNTSVIIDFFRGKPKAREIISSVMKKGDFSISIITYAELIYGAKKSSHFENEQDRIDSFIRDFKIQIIPLSLEVIQSYADIKVSLEKKGSRLDEFDLLIAATAKKESSTLITLNLSHFRRIKNIKLL